MSDYSQPEFYHFTQDSIELAKYVITQIEPSKIFNILDACCGCGVIGLEILKNCSFPNLSKVMAIEKEVSFLNYIKSNSKVIDGKINFEIYITDIQNFLNQPLINFDLIVSNPPYYLDYEGRSSHNPLRDRCMRWSSDDEDAFIRLFKKLSRNGIGYFLSKKSIDDWKIKVEKVDRSLVLKSEKKLAGANVFSLSYFE
ncbi:MAG: hypothetical protein Fur0010_23280 [Bdellovibrio sp.]